MIFVFLYVIFSRTTYNIPKGTVLKPFEAQINNPYHRFKTFKIKAVIPKNTTVCSKVFKQDTPIILSKPSNILVTGDLYVRYTDGAEAITPSGIRKRTFGEFCAKYIPKDEVCTLEANSFVRFNKELPAIQWYSSRYYTEKECRELEQRDKNMREEKTKSPTPIKNDGEYVNQGEPIRLFISDAVLNKRNRIILEEDIVAEESDYNIEFDFGEDRLSNSGSSAIWVTIGVGSACLAIGVAIAIIIIQ